MNSLKLSRRRCGGLVTMKGRLLGAFCGCGASFYTARRDDAHGNGKASTHNNRSMGAKVGTSYGFRILLHIDGSLYLRGRWVQVCSEQAACKVCLLTLFIATKKLFFQDFRKYYLRISKEIIWNVLKKLVKNVFPISYWILLFEKKTISSFFENGCV